MKYAEIVLNVPVPGTFTYISDDDGISAGIRASVMFGRRKMTGFIVAVSDTVPKNCSVEPDKLKKIDRIIDKEPVFTEEQIHLAEWISHYYLCTFGEALSIMIPSGRRESEPLLTGFDEEAASYTAKELSDEQIKAIGKVDVLNFNYTTTYQTIYGGRSLNKHHAVHGGIKNGDIVLGIADDVFPDSYDYIRFQKYFQRIQKRTGNYYRDWLKKEADQEGFFRNKEVWIFGHSLGLADFGVLRVFFENECFARVTIFFHSQRSYESIVINLVKALGKDEVIERIATGKIVFQKLKDPILLKTSSTLGSATKNMNEILRNETVCL